MSQRLFTGQTPSSGENSDGTPGITLGTAVRFAHDGQVSGVEFYATVTVSGTYTVALWRVTAADPNGSGGTLLASKSMAGAPTSAAMNTVLFDSPVSVVSTDLYKVGVFSGDGRYVLTPSFSWPLTNGDITADANGTDPVGLGNLNQGSFTVNASLAYPTGGGGSCYFVGPVFDPAGGSNDLTAALTLPALGAAASLASSATVTSAVTLPALQAAVAAASSAALNAALALPALQAAVSLAASSSLSSAMTLPALRMAGVLSTPVAETSSPSASLSTASRPVVISTISGQRAIITGTRGGL